MTRPPAAIDLGTLPGRPPSETVTPRPARLRQRHRRTAVLALLAVLISFSATAAEAPPRPWLAPHFTVPLPWSLGLSDDTVYVVASDDHTATEQAGRTALTERDGPQTLYAYRLRDGALRWGAPLPDAPAIHVVGLHGGAPVLTSVSPGTGAATVTSLDPETGQARWTRDGAVVAMGNGTLVVDRHGDPSGVHDAVAPHLTVVDAVTGQVRWSLDVVVDAASPPVAN